MVLICPELITELNLKIHPLKEPELVDVTLKNGQKSVTKLYEYIKLSLTSLDAAWTSKSVKALITPGLCMPVILGLPFLMHNTIVVDHSNHTCVDKCANYDLLNPPLIAPPQPPKPHLKEQLKEPKADKKLVLAELLLVCNDQFKNPKLHPELVENFNDIAAIHERIKILACKETLSALEKKMKTEFKEVFEPIQHVNELPTNVYPSIKLKNTKKTIKSCSYPSP